MNKAKNTSSIIKTKQNKKLNMKVSLYIEWKNQQMVEMRKLKKDGGGKLLF